MKIIREINGEKKTFELTDEEMLLAYYEQQAIFDVQDIKDTVSGWSDEWNQDTYHVSSKEFFDMAEEAALEMRRNINKYDMEWSYARDQAITDVIRKRKGEDV